MDFSEHSRNSSSDAGDQDIRYRECDDMSVRRSGNIPAPLRKKKDDTYKRFITPSGDPMTYVKQHMRSKSLSDIQVENAAREQERDERNVRYEEMQKLKEMLKEEEETWTSNLDNWKQRRRSATLDVRKRKEDRESVTQPTPAQRRGKTFKEMMEDKKHRESGLAVFDDNNDDLWSSLPKDTPSRDTNTSRSQTTKRMPYRGAISVPDIGKVQNTRQIRRSPSPPAAKPVAETPVRYTSKVTTMINHVPTKSSESSDFERNESPRIPETKPTQRDRVVSKISNVWPPPPSEPVVAQFSAPAPTRAEPQRSSRPQSTYNATQLQKRSQSPPVVLQTSKNQVQMRHNSPRQNAKERPKSAYGSIGGDRAATLPRNYHSYSGPKPADPSTSDFVQHRKSAFANKRNMWENMAHQKQHSSSTAAPQHLASLLKHDTERLYGSEHEALRNSTSTTPRQSTDIESIESRSPRENGFPEEHPSHQPKIMSTTSSSSTDQKNSLRPWQKTESTFHKTDQKPAHKHVSAPVSRNTWTKSATLPSKARFNLYDSTSTSEVNKPSKPESLPRQNGIDVDLKRSSQSPSSDASAQCDEMKICINQRPKSEKGFGFTVRGGDEGRPVIVNTVSPGGAADICQLCVGDEILAINEVQLSSSLTQDGIVKLIVDSVLTGNLSLDIKRYGKSKKPNPLRLSGTKVVMTPGGFVQVRSDKGKSPVVSTKSFNGNVVNAAEQKSSARLESPELHDLPLPPPPEDLEPPKRLSAMDRLSPKKPSPSAYRRASPLSSLINAAKSTSPRPQDYDLPKDSIRSSQNPSTFRASPKDPDDSLEYEVLKAQHDLDLEENYLQHERRQHEENVMLRKQLMEEQRLLEEREAKREEEKRRRIEEAKAEEQRLEEELRKIEAAKREQQKRREEEKRKLIESQSRFDPTFNHGESNHWLIEEAERSRLAEEEGRRRANVFEYGPNANNFGSPQRNSPSSQPQIPGSLQNYWNDPNTRATLL